MFYWRFYHSQYCTNELLQVHRRDFRAFLSFVEALDQRFQISEKNNREVLANNLIDGTMSGAIKVIRGMYKNDDMTSRHHLPRRVSARFYGAWITSK